MAKGVANPSKPEMYRRLEVLCAQNGLSMAGLAEKIGLSNATASSWGRGVMPNGETLIKMARELKTTIDYILIGENPEPITAPASKTDFQYAMDMMNEMDKRHNETIMRFIDTMGAAQKETNAAIQETNKSIQETNKTIERSMGQIAEQLSLFEPNRTAEKSPAT